MNWVMDWVMPLYSDPKVVRIIFGRISPHTKATPSDKRLVPMVNATLLVLFFLIVSIIIQDHL